MQYAKMLSASRCLLTLIMWSTDHKRTYNVKSHLKVQDSNLTHERPQRDWSGQYAPCSSRFPEHPCFFFNFLNWTIIYVDMANWSEVTFSNNIKNGSWKHNFGHICVRYMALEAGQWPKLTRNTRGLRSLSFGNIKRKPYEKCYMLDLVSRSPLIVWGKQRLSKKVKLAYLP